MGREASSGLVQRVANTFFLRGDIRDDWLGGAGTAYTRKAIVLDHSTRKNTEGAPGSGVGNLGLGVRIVSFYSAVSIGWVARARA